MSRTLDTLLQSQDEIMGERAADAMIESFDRPKAPSPGLGSVPSFEPSVAPESRIEALTNPDEFPAEQFRALGARLQQLAERRPLKTVLVTSASFREGKSLVSVNLAITLARRAGKRVLLVEGDLRKPVLGRMLGLPPRKGLSDWIRCQEPLTNFLCRIADLDLWFLPAGDSCAQPVEALQSPRIREFIDQASRLFDWILVDSAPLVVADPSILSRVVDGTLIVVRQESTQKKALQKSLGALEKVLGFVLNDATSVDPHGYRQHYMPVGTNGNGADRKPHSDSK